jgi:hypothetical protein
MFFFMMEELQDEDGCTLIFYGEKIANRASCYKIFDKIHPPSSNFHFHERVSDGCNDLVYCGHTFAVVFITMAWMV